MIVPLAPLKILFRLCIKYGHQVSVPVEGTGPGGPGAPRDP